MVTYPKPSPAKISSLDITSAAGGLDQRGEANISATSFSVGRNVMVNQQGLATYRYGLKKWLPDTVGTAYQVFPAVWNGVTYYFTADNGKIKYATEGATSWTLCGGDNTIATGTGIITTLNRVLNKIIILNGTDTLGYVDLTTMNVVHYNLVTDPTLAPTATVTGITGTAHVMYYAIVYSSIIGKTKTSPILSQAVSTIREQWKTDGTQGITITDPNTRPTGAVSWSIYINSAGQPGGALPPVSDMLPVAMGLDINTTTWFDNGSVTPSTDFGSAPTVNSTQGPKAKYCDIVNGRPFLYGMPDDPYAVMIGGNGQHALDFGEDNGGYRLLLNDGTNYHPMSIVGFRNGQGIPSITVMFDNMEGLSKQSIIEQNTVSLGTFSATVWGATEQNYGAASVSSPYAMVNYRGMLVFPTVDGILKVDTSTRRLNVLSADRVSDPIIKEINSIKVDRMPYVVGTGWGNKIMFSVAARGFTYNNEIIVYDTTRQGAECWYIFDIASQWIGTIAPPGSAGFVYIAQDNHFFRLEEAYVARDDTSTGVTTPFSFDYKTALIGANTAHNAYYAVVNAVFYLADFIGTAGLTVYWRDYQSRQMKSKSITVTNGTYAKSAVGNWSSPGYQFNIGTPSGVLRWADVDVINDQQNAPKSSKPFPIRLNNVITNELQAEVTMNLDGSALVVRSISFEGQPLGVNPDVR